MPRRARQVLQMLIALSCVLVLAVGIPAGAAQDVGPQGFAVGDSGTRLTWSSAMSGDLVVRLTLGTQGAGQCVLRVDVSGAVGAASVFTYLGHDGAGGGWTALGQPDTHVHADGVAIRSTIGANGWAARHSHVITADIEETYVFAAKGLSPWNDPFAGTNSVVIDIACFGSFEVHGIEASKQVTLTDPQGLRGGAGASTEPYGLSLNVLDGTSRSLTTTDGLLRWRSDDPFGAGVGRVSHPAGGSTRLFSGGDDWFVDGPAGTWSLSLDARASAFDPSAVVVLAGTSPVASLDAAASL